MFADLEQPHENVTTGRLLGPPRRNVNNAGFGTVVNTKGVKSWTRVAEIPVRNQTRLKPKSKAPEEKVSRNPRPNLTQRLVARPTTIGNQAVRRRDALYRDRSSIPPIEVNIQTTPNVDPVSLQCFVSNQTKRSPNQTRRNIHEQLYYLEDDEPLVDLNKTFSVNAEPKRLQNMLRAKPPLRAGTQSPGINATSRKTELQRRLTYHTNRGHNANEEVHSQFEEEAYGPQSEATDLNQTFTIDRGLNQSQNVVDAEPEPLQYTLRAQTSHRAEEAAQAPHRTETQSPGSTARRQKSDFERHMTYYTNRGHNPNEEVHSQFEEEAYGPQSEATDLNQTFTMDRGLNQSQNVVQDATDDELKVFEGPGLTQWVEKGQRPRGEDEVEQFNQSTPRGYVMAPATSLGR
jgi:hypothetical protein